MNESIDPRNNRLLRELFQITSTHTNPDSIDMSAVIPVIDMGQGGWARGFPVDSMRSAYRLLNTFAAGNITLSRLNIIQTNPAPSVSDIHIPPGFDFLICRVMYEAQIEEFPWLVKFNGRSLRFWLSVTMPSANAGGGTLVSQNYNWDLKAETFRNMYAADFRQPMIIPNGGSASWYVGTDNNLAGWTSYGNWRTGGNGMDIPFDAVNIVNFLCMIWGILIPPGMQIPAAGCP